MHGAELCSREEMHGAELCPVWAYRFYKQRVRRQRASQVLQQGHLSFPWRQLMPFPVHVHDRLRSVACCRHRVCGLLLRMCELWQAITLLFLAESFQTDNSYFNDACSQALRQQNACRLDSCNRASPKRKYFLCNCTIALLVLRITPLTWKYSLYPLMKEGREGEGAHGSYYYLTKRSPSSTDQSLSWRVWALSKCPSISPHASLCRA